MKKRIIYSMFSFLLIVFGLFFSGCSLFDSSSDSGSNTSSKIYYINDTVTNSEGVKFTVLSVKNTQLLGSTSWGDTTEYNFAVLTIKVENNSNKEISLSNSGFELYRRSNNAKYEYFSTLYIDDLFLDDLGAGLSKTFEIAFEIPTKTTDEDYEVSIGYSSWTLSSKRVKILLKEKTPSPNTPTSPNPSPEINTEQNFYHKIGETFTFNGLEVTILNWGFYANYDKNNDIINVKLNIYNPTTKSVSLDDLSFVLIYNVDYKYNCVWDGTMDYIQWHSSISPLENLDAVYCGYKTPELVDTAKESLQLRISTAYTNATEFHYITLRSGETE